MCAILCFEHTVFGSMEGNYGETAAMALSKSQFNEDISAWDVSKSEGFFKGTVFVDLGDCAELLAFCLKRL